MRFFSVYPFKNGSRTSLKKRSVNFENEDRIFVKNWRKDAYRKRDKKIT